MTDDGPSFFRSASPQRLEHLDSLRGIAAAIVTLGHCFFVYSELHGAGVVALLGQGAVLFFFVLSGYVLGRSLLRTPTNRPKPFVGFVVRRIFRLYPAFLFALFLCALVTLLPPLPEYKFASGQTLWFQGNAFEQSASWWFFDLTLLKFDLIPVAWTLQVEFVCSLLLPFLIAAAPRLGKTAVLFLVVSAAWMIAAGAFESHDGSIFGHAASTTRYLFAFYCGLLLNHAGKLLEHLNEKLSLKITLFCSALLVPFCWLGNSIYTTNSWLQVPLIVLLTVLLAVMIHCRIEPLKRLLLSRPLLILGRRSYSVYLLHSLAILGGLWIMHFLFPAGLSDELASAFLLFAIVWPVTLLLSVFSERFAERPLNAVGHRLAKTLIGTGPA